MSFKISATFLQFFVLMSSAVFDFIQLSGLFSLLKNHPPSARSQFHRASYVNLRTYIVLIARSSSSRYLIWWFSLKQLTSLLFWVNLSSFLTFFCFAFQAFAINLPCNHSYCCLEKRNKKMLKMKKDLLKRVMMWAV
jgi:hypothetical protein